MAFTPRGPLTAPQAESSEVVFTSPATGETAVVAAGRATSARGTAVVTKNPDQLVLTTRGYYWPSTEVVVHKHTSLRAIQRPLLAAMGGRVRQVAVIAPDGAFYDEFGSQPFVAAQNGDEYETQLEPLETPDLFAPTRAGLERNSV